MFSENPSRSPRADRKQQEGLAGLPITIALAEVDETMGPLVGGKAVNLGRLVGLGFAVPAGFSVTTQAYRQSVPAGAIEPLVEELAASRPTDQLRLRERARAIRELILGESIPAPIGAAISSGYDRLGGGSVAVRSSATAEDLPTASFAGQLDSELNVEGLGPLLRAVSHCWASLWSDRAVIYRAERGIDQRSVDIAVVVQTMVAPRVAGVLFTANPLTGRRGESVVEAVAGLGEALVSGAVTPDHYLVASDGETVIEQRSTDRRGSGLELRELRSIVHMGARIAAAFGAPQDVEWAIDQTGRAWILQARSITTLFPLPSGVPESSEELRVYYSLNASQGMERPFTPLGESILRLLISSVVTIFGVPPADPWVGPSFLSRAAGRLYLDLTPALRSRVGRRIVLSMVGAVQERAAGALEGLSSDRRFSIIPRSPLPFLRRALAFVVRSGLLPLLIVAPLRPEAIRKRIERVGEQIRSAGRGAERIDAASLPKRLEAVEQLLSPANLRPLLTLMPSVLLPVRGFLAAARGVLRGLASDAEMELCLRALPNNPTTEMDLELWRLASSALEGSELRDHLGNTEPEVLAQELRDGRLPSGFAGAFAVFLRRYGHRCASELDAGLPRWSENPAPLFAMMAGYLRRGSGPGSPEELFRTASASAEGAIVDLSTRAAGGRGGRGVVKARRRGAAGRGGSVLGALRGGIVALSLRRARALAGLQEAPRSLIALLFATVRHLLEPVAEALVENGTLASTADLAFLSLPEIAAALREASTAANCPARKADYAREVARRSHPILLLSDGSVLEGGSGENPPAGMRLRAGMAPEAAPPGSSVLSGIPASAGSVRGRARILFDPEGASLAPGEILVAPSTDPGWTPLFLIAGGLVMESGGPMSHAAIVAREYGIPAVVGVVGATQLLRDGQELFLDGSNGIVRVL